MTSYLIRLDDACPTMNHESWGRVEKLLDRWAIKPIVGIIPDNKDTDFCWEAAPDFWSRARGWQGKGWTIALHGLHHQYITPPPRKQRYFQKSHSLNTEFAGVARDVQRCMLLDGLGILKEHGIEPTCFFAPAHTYDFNTVELIREMPQIRFISDGYALRPYRKSGMVFIPSICDGPFKMPFGLYTYVFHPSMMGERQFARLERFLSACHGDIVTAGKCLEHVANRQGAFGVLLENGIYVLRGIRNFLRR